MGEGGLEVPLPELGEGFRVRVPDLVLNLVGYSLPIMLVSRVAASGLSVLGWLALAGQLPAIAQFRVDRPDFFEDGQRQFEQEIRQLEQQQQPKTLPTLTVDTGAWRWSRVVLRDGGCAVWLPAGPLAQESETVETPEGAIHFDAIASHPPNARFVIAASEPLDPALLAAPDALLTRARDRLLARAANFELSGSRDITFKGYAGRDFMLASDTEQLTFRLLLANDRLYVLAASQDRAGANLEAIATFFGSFELL